MRRFAHGCADHFGGSHERISFAYEMRLGETEPGTAPGTFNRSIYVPAFSSGVWLRMSTLDGTFTRDVCQVAITDTVESSSDACTVEVYERDERGMLQGVVLHVSGLDEAGYFETDARELRRNREGGWDGETAGRSVKLWGYLTPEGEK
ncbi:hypothetical protein [Microbacterium lacticum]